MSESSASWFLNFSFWNKNISRELSGEANQTENNPMNGKFFQRDCKNLKEKKNEISQKSCGLVDFISW